MSVHTLSSLILPADAGYRRDAPKRTVIKADRFWDRYDSRTLIYDCYFDADLRTLTFLLPRSFNFADLIKRAVFRADGQILPKPKWRKWRHHETLTFKAVQAPQSVTIQINDMTLTAPVNTVDRGLDGLNTIYTLSRDNDLKWISDWVQFHVTHHDLQAVVLFDNGSTAYDPTEIDVLLSSITGIKAVRVIKADLPHGPLNSDCAHRSEAKFLQVAMLNLARDRFMARSRAMLHLDIDEMLVSTTGENIFDATVNDRWGHLTFPGIWHYPSPATADVTHGSHRHIRAGDTLCPTKFALNPQGIFGRAALQVHSLERINRKFRFAPARFWFMHCHGISTSWKYARTSPKGEFLPASDTALRALDAGFQQ